MLSSSKLLSSLLLISTSYPPSILGQVSSAGGSSTAAGSSPAPAPVAAGSSPAPATGTSSSSGGSSIGSLAAGLSTSCQTAAGSLLTSEFGTCSNIIGLVSVVGATGSVISPLNNWISGVCSATPCSNATLTSATQTITSGCGADALKGSAIAAALTNIISNYNPVKDLLCTQYSSNSTFCVPYLLGNVQTATGINITLNEVVSMLSGGASQSFANVPPSAYCNDCGHALVTQSNALTAATNVGSVTAGTNVSSTGASSSAAGVCGASFNDNKLPSTIRIAGKDASGNAKNGSAFRPSASMANVGIAGLAASLVFLNL